MARSRIAVYLFQRKRKMGGEGAGREVLYYLVRWRSASGIERSMSLGKCSEITRVEAKKQRAIKEDEINRDVADRIPDIDESMTLGELLAFYPANRARGDAAVSYQALKDFRPLSAGTLRSHCMVIRYLIEHFGESCKLEKLTEADVLIWHRSLYDGKLSGARAAGWGSKDDPDKRLSTNSIRSHTRSIKAVFRWAMRRKLIRVDPFEGLIGSGVPGKRSPYVPMADYEALCEVAPEPWRVLFSLCRLAGLRRDEALTLPWDGTAEDREGQEWRVGVKWPAVGADGKKRRGRLLVCSTKTHRYREVPIVDDLLLILEKAHLRAPSDTGRICAPISSNNLPREIQKFMRQAGLDEWIKPYQALRASRVNDWKNDGHIPESTMLSWIGHSKEVSRENYQAPTDEEFDRAVA